MKNELLLVLRLNGWEGERKSLTIRITDEEQTHLIKDLKGKQKREKSGSNFFTPIEQGIYSVGGSREELEKYLGIKNLCPAESNWPDKTYVIFNEGNDSLKKIEGKIESYSGFKGK